MYARVRLSIHCVYVHTGVCTHSLQSKGIAAYGFFISVVCFKRALLKMFSCRRAGGFGASPLCPPPPLTCAATLFLSPAFVCARQDMVAELGGGAFDSDEDGSHSTLAKRLGSAGAASKKNRRERKKDQKDGVASKVSPCLCVVEYPLPCLPAWTVIPRDAGHK